MELDGRMDILFTFSCESSLAGNCGTSATTPFVLTLSGSCQECWVLIGSFIVAIFYPFSQFCEINISLLSLQTQPNTAPNLFQRGVEYGKYDERSQGPADGHGAHRQGIIHSDITNITI